MIRPKPFVQVAFKRGVVYTLKGPTGLSRKVVYEGRAQIRGGEVFLFTPKHQFNGR